VDLHQYCSNSRDEMRPFLPERVGRALDIGCGPGGFGATLRDTYPGAWLAAVEPEPTQAAGARTQFDEVFDGFFPEALPPSVEPFDLVTMLDVIEHVVDPWTMLADVRRHLAPRGAVVAAIPNIQYLPTSANLLLRGRWTYTDEGLLDRTHLRFFTRETVSELFSSAGYRIEQVGRVNPPWDRKEASKAIYRPLRRLRGTFSDSLYMHFAVVARPA
jgi:trans-aconitate methyltransferase